MTEKREIDLNPPTKRGRPKMTNAKPSSVYRHMRKGKKYRLRDLMDELKVTRQAVNQSLNNDIKNGFTIREGTRKWYIYTIK